MERGGQGMGMGGQRVGQGDGRKDGWVGK